MQREKEESRARAHSKEKNKYVAFRVRHGWPRGEREINNTSQNQKKGKSVQRAHQCCRFTTATTTARTERERVKRERARRPADAHSAIPCAAYFRLGRSAGDRECSLERLILVDSIKRIAAICRRCNCTVTAELTSKFHTSGDTERIVLIKMGSTIPRRPRSRSRARPNALRAMRRPRADICTTISVLLFVRLRTRAANALSLESVDSQSHASPHRREILEKNGRRKSSI